MNVYYYCVNCRFMFLGIPETGPAGNGNCARAGNQPHPLGDERTQPVPILKRHDVNTI